jgi:hypothetical protein
MGYLVRGYGPEAGAVGDRSAGLAVRRLDASDA